MLRINGRLQVYDNLTFAITLLAALGSGLMAGVFFAFSTFVMKALASLPPPQGIAAMQSINVAVLNRWFLGVFFGTAVLCVLIAVAALVEWRAHRVLYLVSGSAFYLAGVTLVTVLFNVPKNNKLAAIEPIGGDSAIQWTNYITRWTTWNHVRTVTALSAAASLTMALR
jgi:uncharacterized membrane protein